MKTFIIFVVFLIFQSALIEAKFSAGAGRSQMSPPPGTPLGAYNHGERKVPHFPVPQFRTYSTFLEPNQGVLNPVYARALVLNDGNNTVCFVTFDLMAVDEPMTYLAWLMAAAQGFPVPFERCTFTGSHTHSSYGAWMSQFAIQITPTMDLFVPAVQKAIAAAAADAMVSAWQNMAPAQVGVTSGILTNVTHNRRAGTSPGDSPYVTSGTIDPHMGILRVDDLSGKPIATVWNYACHGTCYGPENMKASGDILGVANQVIEETLGGYALFLQADAGDVSPNGESCENAPMLAGGVTMGNAAMNFRLQATTYTEGTLTPAWNRIDMGLGNMQWDAARNMDCPMIIFGIDVCQVFANVTLSIPGGQSWLEETPRLNSLRLDLGNTSNVFITCPVEAIVEFGWWIRNATADIGFDTTFFVGYTNSYLMYLCTPNEWDLTPNGYECSLNLWGRDESTIFYNAMFDLLKQVAPPQSPNPKRFSYHK